jgi:hypothetical protein
VAQSTDTSINAGLSGLAVRNGINENLAALFSCSSGASAPSPTIGGMLWLDTSPATPVLRIRNNANTAWLAVVTSDYATATGLSLIQAASVTAARSAISVPPAPTASAGVGQWASLTSSVGAALVLPAGGTWALYAGTYSATGAFGGSTFGVAAGGSSVGAAIAGNTWNGFAWRIA